MHDSNVINDLQSVSDLKDRVSMLPPLEIPLSDAVGCVVAQDISAGGPVPNFDVVTISGYAVRSSDVEGARADLPVSLTLDDPILPGQPTTDPLAPGHAARVVPGSSLPTASDTVVRDTLAAADEERVRILGPVGKGEGLIPEGSQFGADDLVARAGDRLGYSAVSPLGACGHDFVGVHPRPRVVLVTVGGEYIRVSDDGQMGSHHDSTSVLLGAQARRLGADVYRLGPVGDDERRVRDAVEDQLVRADLLVTLGGIDGPQDVLRSVLERAEAANFDTEPIDPLSTYGLGILGTEEVPIVALPGSPVQALQGFWALVPPLIAAMRGEPDTIGTIATTVHDLPHLDRKRSLLGAWDGHTFRPAQPTGVRDLLSINACAVVQPGGGSLPALVRSWDG